MVVVVVIRLVGKIWFFESCTQIPLRVVPGTFVDDACSRRCVELEIIDPNPNDKNGTMAIQYKLKIQ